MSKTDWQFDGDLQAIARHLVECCGTHEGKSRLIGNARAEDIGKIAEHYLKLLRFQLDLIQDQFEGSLVPVTLLDEARRVIAEQQPGHPFLTKPMPSYGVWEMQRLRLEKTQGALATIRDTAIAMCDAVRSYPDTRTMICVEGPQRIKDAANAALR